MHNRSGRLIARTFDAENVSAGHSSSLNVARQNSRTPRKTLDRRTEQLSGQHRARLQYAVMSSGTSNQPQRESQHDSQAASSAEPVKPLYDTRLPELSRGRRMQVPLIAVAVIAIIRVF